MVQEAAIFTSIYTYITATGAGIFPASAVSRSLGAHAAGGTGMAPGAQATN